MDKKLFILVLLLIITLAATVYVMGFYKKPPSSQNFVWKPLIEINPLMPKVGDNVEIRALLQLEYPESYCITIYEALKGYSVNITILDQNQVIVSRFFSISQGSSQICINMKKGDNVTIGSFSYVFVYPKTYIVQADFKTSSGDIVTIKKELIISAPQTGIEPVTSGLEGQRYVQAKLLGHIKLFSTVF